MLNEFPSLATYVARGEARAAYKRAFAAQLAVNAGRGGLAGAIGCGPLPASP